MTFPLSIYSLDREVFTDQANAVTLPGSEGQFQILAHHIPFISLLKEGEVKIEKKDGSLQSLPIQGGVVEVTPGKVVALVEF